MSTNWNETENSYINHAHEESEQGDILMDTIINLPNGHATKRDYLPMHIGELLNQHFPVRKTLLAPWLPERSLSMVYGARGVGKSMLSLSIAVAVASGRAVLGWQPSGKHAVLYVDGEMAREDLQARARRFGGDDVSSLPLHFMARDLYPDGMPTLNVDKVKDAIEEAARIQDAKLIVLDNLSTLWRGSENEAEAWDGMQDWLFRLRRAGRSVLIVHHSGKNGSQRGSSRKEDTLDVVVALRRPSSSDSTNGAAFNVHFEKTRQCFGQAAAPFHAALDEASLSGIDGWVRTAVKIDTMIDEMDAMRKDGKTLEQIGQRFGIDKSTVSRKLRLVPVPEASSPPPEVAGDSREVPDGGNP